MRRSGRGRGLLGRVPAAEDGREEHRVAGGGWRFGRRLDEVVDVLFDGSEFRVWRRPKLDTASTHGTGCTLASALAVGLGAGLEIEEAVEKALHYVWSAIEHGPGLGEGTGPLGHGLGIRPFELIHKKDM